MMLCRLQQICRRHKRGIVWASLLHKNWQHGSLGHHRAASGARIRHHAEHGNSGVRSIPTHAEMNEGLLAGALPEDTLEVKALGEDAGRYWQSRAAHVKQGTAMVAQHVAPIFESMTSHKEIGVVPAGGKVVAQGPPEMDPGGFLCIPIAPRGVVELLLFRGLGVPLPEEGICVGVFDGADVRKQSS